MTELMETQETADTGILWTCGGKWTNDFLGQGLLQTAQLIGATLPTLNHNAKYQSLYFVKGIT